MHGMQVGFCDGLEFALDSESDAHPTGVRHWLRVSVSNFVPKCVRLRGALDEFRLWQRALTITETAGFRRPHQGPNPHATMYLPMRTSALDFHKTVQGAASIPHLAHVVGTTSVASVAGGVACEAGGAGVVAFTALDSNSRVLQTWAIPASQDRFGHFRRVTRLANLPAESHFVAVTIATSGSMLVDDIMVAACPRPEAAAQPQPPTDLTSEPQVDRAFLTSDGPAVTGGSPVWGYNLTYNLDGVSHSVYTDSQGLENRLHNRQPAHYWSLSRTAQDIGTAR